jgi:ABC-type lipoprotein release transport system permease subunit
VAGLVLSVLARLLLRATLPFTVDVFDPVGLLVAPIPLAIAAYIACRIPASRAARIDPNVALRQL